MANVVDHVAPALSPTLPTLESLHDLTQLPDRLAISRAGINCTPMPYVGAPLAPAAPAD